MHGPPILTCGLELATDPERRHKECKGKKEGGGKRRNPDVGVGGEEAKEPEEALKKKKRQKGSKLQRGQTV